MTTAPVRTSIIAGLAATASVLMLAGPASAASKTFDDPKGDAVRAIDVTSLTVRNATHRVRLDYGFRDLTKSKVGTLAVYVVPEEGTPAQAFASRNEDGTFTTLIFSGESPTTCGNATVELSKDLVVWSIPQGCLDNNGSAVRVQASVTRVADPARGVLPYTDSVPGNDGVTSKIPFA